MKPHRNIMAILAGAVFGLALRALIGWWKNADMSRFWIVFGLFALAALFALVAFAYAFGFLSL